MLIPIKWMEKFVEINVPIQELADKMTMSGSKVEEIRALGADITKVVVGEIVSISPHPDADKLVVCQVDIGKDIIQIVTGAPNVLVGQLVPVAIEGAILPGGLHIKKGKLRGVESAGMMCSGEELTLTEADYPGAEVYGILVLREEYPLGMDIKEALDLGGDVIDFEITANRPDCLCMNGMAREIALTLGVPAKMPAITVAQGVGDISQEISIHVEEPELCPRYAARVVKNIKMGPSPRWMRRRLAAAGVRPINNIVDITNYVMLEMGQPMHAFDLRKITGRKIVVRRATENEALVTLDDKLRTLNRDMLVIADSEKPVAIAGVMGGANSEINEETKDILLESAIFYGASVRTTSKALGLRSEASGRFEKGLNMRTTMDALNRAAQLIQELNAGTVVEGIQDVLSTDIPEQKMTVSWGRINDLLGLKLSSEEISEILQTAGIQSQLKGDLMDVSIPYYRLDMEGVADLAEEVARIYGYNRIPITLMEGSASRGVKTPRRRLLDAAKEALTGMGLYEAVTYSFTSPRVYETLGMAPDTFPLSIKISNPLGEDQSIMRTTLIPSILEVLSRNFNRRIPSCGIFEINNIFLPKALPLVDLPEEISTLTLGSYGEGADFYTLKGMVENLLEVFGLRETAEFVQGTHSAFHPGRTAKIRIEGQDVGILGEIHPTTTENYQMQTTIYMAEINMEQLISHAVMEKKNRTLPKYPAVTRDLALIVPKEIPAGEIHRIILDNGSGILEQAVLFDIYEGSQVPSGSKSLAYALSYRATDRTLKDEEVQTAHRNILGALEEAFGVKIR